MSGLFDPPREDKWPTKPDPARPHVPIPFAGASAPEKERREERPGVVGSGGPGPGGGSTQGGHSLQTGDAFVILDIPLAAQVGCDTIVLTVKKAPAGSGVFSGFRDLPPGAHLAWMSSPGAMARQGYWFVTRRVPGVARIKRWDRSDEVLAPCLASDTLAANPQLLPYDVGRGQQAVPLGRLLPRPTRGAPDLGTWPSVTSCITESVLGRITGTRSGAPAATEWLLSTSDTAKGESAIPGTGPPSGSSEFDFLLAKHDLDPYQLVASHNNAESANRDTTGQPATPDTTDRIAALLEHSPERLSDGDVVGELQFAFLTGTLLCNLSCLDHWWHLVLRIFLRARSLALRRPALCLSFIRTLHSQFLYLERHVAGGFLGQTTGTAAAGDADVGSAGIFDIKPQGAARLQVSLTAFKHHLEDALRDTGKRALPEAAAAAGEAFADLEAFLWKYGWDLRGDSVSGAGYGSADGDDGEEIEAYDSVPDQAARPRKAHNNPDLSDTDSESDQPVVVELDEDGREVGLVSWH